MSRTKTEVSETLPNTGTDIAREQRKKELAEKRDRLHEQLTEIAKAEADIIKAERAERGQLLLKHLPALLEICTEHESSNCSDVNRYGADEDSRRPCARCILLGIQAEADWQGWPDDVVIEIRAGRRGSV